MPTRVDLDQYEANVKNYLAGGIDSAGWPLLDNLERYLAVGLIESGSADEQRARKLLASIRSRLTKAHEVEQTQEVLKRVSAEYRAGLQALAPQVAGHHIDLGHYNAVVLKLFEKKMFEARLGTAQARQ